MLHALPSTHVLEVSRFNERSVTHAILMFEFTGEYISEDFGILMGMGGKPPPGSITSLFITIKNENRCVPDRNSWQKRKRIVHGAIHARHSLVHWRVGI